MSTVQMEMGTGLWDTSTGAYSVPGQVANATTPGGASPDHEAIFDLGFRAGLDERLLQQIERSIPVESLPWIVIDQQLTRRVLLNSHARSHQRRRSPASGR